MYETIAGYLVERKKVKNINIRVKKDLTVYICAPLNLDKYYINQFILSKKEWIEKTKKKIQNYIDKLEVEVYENDSKYRILDKIYTIKIKENKKERIEFFEKDKIVIIFTSDNSKENIEKQLKNYEYNLAVNIFKKRLDYYANIMNLEYEKLIINSIKGKWGYCKPLKKIIALNTKLIKRSLFEIDYVIIHELAHLVHPNHSKNFYRYVENYFKDYKKGRKVIENIKID